MIFTQVDDIAFAGYDFAAGRGAVPALGDQMDIDAFNAGIANFNATHGANIPPLFERTRTLMDGTNTGRYSDKDLALVGA